MVKRKQDMVLEDGVIVGRRNEHPHADLFKDVPMGGANLPNMNLPPEFRHLLAIHIFDNLDCSLPRNPRYVHRQPDKVPEGTHAGAGGVWVPTAQADDPAFAEVAASITVPDPAHWSDEKLNAAELVIKRERMQRKLVAQADPHITTKAEAAGTDEPTPTGQVEQ